MHFAQIMKTGEVRFYDLGSNNKNKEFYGASQPPLIDITQI
jgi:hypothetical protein